MKKLRLPATLFAWIAAIAVASCPARSSAADFPWANRSDPNRANSSRAARDEAVQSVPMNKLPTDARNKITWVLNNTSIYRRLPIRVIPCDPELYLFLVQHPDVVVNMWEVLAVSRLTMQQIGPDVYRVTDDIGTVGAMQFLYRSQDTHVIYVDGTYQGSMFGHGVRGRGLLILKSGYVQEADGRSYITCRLDTFMNIEPDSAEFLTKTFQPVVGKVADINFTQTTNFVASLCRTAELNNAGVQRLGAKLTKVKPEVRQQFAEISSQVAVRSGVSAAPAVPTGPAATVEIVTVDPDAAPRVAQRPNVTALEENASKPSP